MLVVDGRDDDDVVEWMKEKDGRSGRGDYLYLGSASECDCASVPSVWGARLGSFFSAAQIGQENAALRFQSADQSNVVLPTFDTFVAANAGSTGNIQNQNSES